MKVEQRFWSETEGWQGSEVRLGERAQLLLVFGGTAALEQARWKTDLVESYPRAKLFGCSTAGEIFGTRVYDDTVVSTAIAFESTRFETARVDMTAVEGSSRRAGEALGRALPHEGLVHVLVLSDGQVVNGSELVRGLVASLPEGVGVTGGLAGDGARFERTLLLADGALQQGAVAVIGFYGDRLKVGYGSLGGWDPFGPVRVITRSDGNVLYELDGKPALDLYKTYLGEHAAGLPATGLLFPLEIRRTHGAEALVRTILSVDDAQNSLTFAGDVPEGSQAQLMKANFERLIDGAEGAARASQQTLGGGPVELAVLISCVGRKLVLKQRTEEEVESVRDVLGGGAVLAGFYSYGEISPTVPGASCDLHNQTMTITTFSES
jgi:hypothetical protein